MRRCEAAGRVSENRESRRSEDPKMRSCGEGFRKSGELKIRRSEDAKLRGGFQKIWRAEDPKIRRCEAAERVSENLEGRRQIQLIIQRNMLYKNEKNICPYNATKMRRCEDVMMQDQGNVHPALQYCNSYSAATDILVVLLVLSS